jgi:hypothetical protein
MRSTLFPSLASPKFEVLHTSRNHYHRPVIGGFYGSRTRSERQISYYYYYYYYYYGVREGHPREFWSAPLKGLSASAIEAVIADSPGRR